ncbi:Cocaine esterase [Cladobotryum mycophilum]|uniref:Cocaine esterase n=1 Tax=Cladobotryum mycophilum TaxID=491253 RepID=A0ABR0SRG7_9HYPO
MATSIGGLDIIFGDPRQPKALPLSHSKARWGGFKTERKVLPKGSQKRKGCRSLPCDILFERDTPVKLRDGTTVYADIYRPVDETAKSPVVIAWSPYGKEGGRGNQVLDDFPFRMAVPLEKLSEWQKWEGPDPAEWVQHGYAIVNPDPRGVGKSEGNIYQFGSQEGRDGADVVDWVGSQSWCSGKVALSGNSYLSISQWFIAAERPKHLAAIAPWEGSSDLFREALTAGGVLTSPAMSFNLQLMQVNAGENTWENTVAMLLKHRQHGEYHDDKRARVENIDVPAYVVASWSNPIHTWGTFCAYGRLDSEKWLRVHDTWEWPDYYEDANIADLRRFFDYYLKGIDNKWPETPRFRAKILDTSIPTAKSGSNFVSSAFPPPEMKPQKLWIDGISKTFTAKEPDHMSRHDCRRGSDVSFTYTFSKDVILCGPVQLLMPLSVSGSEDCDVFIRCGKISTKGNMCSQLVVPFQKFYQSSVIRFAHRLGINQVKVLFYEGPKGQVRISHRETDPKLSCPGFPISRLDKRSPVRASEVAQVQLPLTPIGMRFAAGEKLEVRISLSDDSVMPPVDQASLTVEGLEDYNKDAVLTCHSGPETGGGYIILPVLETAGSSTRT